MARKRKFNWSVALAAAKEAARIGYYRPYRTTVATFRLNRLPPREQADNINAGTPSRAERRARAIEKSKRRYGRTRRDQLRRKLGMPPSHSQRSCT